MKASLTQTDRHLLASLAVRVIDAEPADRDRVIAEATADRPDLYDALSRLIDESASEQGDDPLADLAEVFRLALTDEVGDPFDQSGTTIDRYTLLHRLGSGAYGAVYRAEQSLPVQRQVALKLLHPGVGSPRVLRRFSLERRVLASLDHPGIARLIDAGTAPDGRPYFVMDLVEGPNLIAYCRENSLSLDERIRLMAGVCDAVQHAHGRGVIHRDLKPGNILVRIVDGVGLPIVIDFGVARLLDPDQEPALTSLGHPIGTRRYMSPEQRGGEVADIRSDVYSLGITLLDLVDIASTESGGSDFRSGLVPAADALQRSAAALPKEVRWVVERCCASNTQERYQSVSELASDLRRYLAGEPLIAGPPSAVYRACKLLLRNPWPAAFLVLVIASLSGFAMYSQSARRSLEVEAVAQRELVIATIDDILDHVWVFAGTEDLRDAMVVRLLGHTDAMLQQRPDDQRLLHAKARLLRQQAIVLGDLTRFDEMEASCRSAATIYARLAAERPGDIELMREYIESVVRIGDSFRLRDNHDEAERFFDRAHKMLENELGKSPGHVGLMDDLYWSHERRMFRTKGPDRVPLLLGLLEHANRLVEAEPGRTLSWHALQNAHYLLGWYYCESEPRQLDLARTHLDEAIHIGADLSVRDAGRASYEHFYLESVRKRLACDWHERNIGAISSRLNWAEILVSDIEARSHGSWSTMNAVLAFELDLALYHDAIGDRQKSLAHARRVIYLCEYSRLASIPRYAEYIEKHRARAESVMRRVESMPAQ